MQVSSQLALMTEVDDAVRLAASDRVLRLLIQNLPKLPERPAYRLFLAHYFLRRNRTPDAIRVARHCLDRGLAAGDMVLAIGAQRILEQAGEQAPAESILALSDLPRAPVGRGLTTAEPLDLTADRPRLPQDLLISVAVEMAAGGMLASEAVRGLGHVPVLTELPPASLRWTLENLSLCTFEKGDALFASGEHYALWWIWGGLDAGAVAGAPAPGSFLVVDGGAHDLRASSFCIALGLPAHFSDMWCFLPGVDDALVTARLRGNARIALSRALGALLQESDDGFEVIGSAALGADELVATVPERTEALLVLSGAARVASTDGQPFVLHPGDAAALPLGADEVRGLEQGTRVVLFARQIASSGRALASPTQANLTVGDVPSRGETRPAGLPVVAD